MIRSRPLTVALAWLPVVSYTLLIWWLSSQVFQFELMDELPWRDKGVHFVEYGAMGFFIAHAIATTWPGRGIAGIVVSVLMTVMLGLLDELHQAFVPGRSSDVLDLVADGAGALVAVLFYAALARLVRGAQSERTDLIAPQ